MQQADWGKLKEIMSAQLKAFIALPLNVIITVHVDVTQDEEQRQIYAPALQGAIKNEIAGWVDFSLLAFRQKETAPDGTSSVKYYLKNEGDAKNPHVGNRGGGRVPEICEPDFMTLHNYVYDGLDLPQTEVVSMDLPKVESVEAAPPEETPVSRTTATTRSTRPARQRSRRCTRATSSCCRRTWTTGRWARPADREVQHRREGGHRDEPRNHRGALRLPRGQDAWHGSTEPDELKPTVAKKAAVAAAPAEPASAPVVAVPPPDEPIVTEAEAIETVEKQLGGVVLGQQITADATCDVCGNQVDDLDIANLGNSRFRKVMCISDYKNANREKEAASA